MTVLERILLWIVTIMLALSVSEIVHLRIDMVTQEKTLREEMESQKTELQGKIDSLEAVLIYKALQENSNITL